MAILGVILYIVGLLAAAVGGIWIIVLAFKKSIGWGLASLFIPFVGLVFAFMNWALCKRPFLIWLLGVILLVIGAVLGVVGGGGLEAPTGYEVPTP